jgi:cell division protein FtsQ
MTRVEIRPRKTKAQAPVAPHDVRMMNVLAVVFVLAALALIAAGTWSWMKSSPYLTLRTIRIDGDLVKTDMAALRAYAAPKVAGNFFALDLAQARGVFEAVPWVRRANVRRVWPNVLEVSIEEHRAVAFWDDGDGRAKLVNEYGEVFDANLGEADEALPTLRGPEGTARRMLVVHQQLVPVLAPMLEPMGSRLEQLRLSRRGSWQAVLDNGTVIELGRAGDGGDTAELLERTARFVRTVGEVQGRFGQPAIRHADLRHVNGYALRLDGVATAAQPLNPTPKPGIRR